MAYCVEADVRAYVMNAPSDADLDPYIAEAGGIIDAELRGSFRVPLEFTGATDQYVVTIAAKLAGSSLLAAMDAKRRDGTSERAQELRDQAMQMLDDIRETPGRISAAQLEASDLTDDMGEVMTSRDDAAPIFDMGPETGWGES